METSSRKNLTNHQRQLIFEALLKQSENGKLRRDSVVAAQFSVCTKTICRIWHQALPNIANGSSVNVSHGLSKRAGRKRVQIDPTMISAIPLRKRTNIRSLAKAANIAKSTLHRRIKEGIMRPHSNALKPALTDENKRARLRFSLSMLEEDNLPNKPIFKTMFNFVHIDEKWFNLTKESQKYYLLPEEEEPLRCYKSKCFITKVMFLAVVARPRFSSSGNEEFSGKIGIFPFTFQEAAKCNSKNRSAGTLETKPILLVTKDVIRSCLINKVLPAIRSKWPHSDGTVETIFIQQDNARPHIDPNDLKFLEAASRDGFDIRLPFQPPNNSDFNVLDLGYFRAIPSLQYQEAPQTIDELVCAVQKSFEELSSKILNYVFLTFQSCMIKTMKVFGGNNYKVPHMGKNQLARNGNLPIQLECDAELVEVVRHHLEQQH